MLVRIALALLAAIVLLLPDEREAAVTAKA